MFSVMIIATAVSIAAAQGLPTVHVTKDDVRITQSCLVVIPADTIIEDTNGNGVIQIAASNVEVTFAPGSQLRGSPRDRRPDEYKGYGIRIDGQSNVTIKGARISGFWSGLWATKANGLTLDTIDASDNRRAYLKSTPAAEDSDDWLFPHDNDQNQWLENYGAAMYVEDSNQITVRNSKVRHGQNALCLDRVNGSKIYDNNFSFNSGWGIALWRSSRNTISRNACDFCVRGYSHGVYNRGQDSAGILMFEQNCDNVVAENSATHGGDSFFGFGGKEALGEVGEHPPDWYKGRGNNNNLLIGNDFSYAPAHGIEMTFSFGNVFCDNRLVENAICGVWGGFSQNTLIARNQIEGNGEMAYGLERGGVNIDHGVDNRIVGNAFKANKCGVHLWGGQLGSFAERPWAKANNPQSKGNLVAGNQFVGDLLTFHLRGPGELVLGENSLENVTEEMSKETESLVRKGATAKLPEKPRYVAHGSTHPIGARPQLRGRQNIIMTEWGPWDHESPLVRMVQDTGDSVRYDLHNVSANVAMTIEGSDIVGESSQNQDARTFTLSSTKPGVHPYVLRVKDGDWQREIRGTLISATWDAAFFKWADATDPRNDLAAWRKLSQGRAAASGRVKQLAFKYGWGGPSEQNLSDSITAAKLGGDHFGMIAKAQLPLSAGTWEFTTLSDDGVRVVANGKPVIENWAWHGPTRDAGTLTLDKDQTVEIVVEHFEIDGYSVLELGVSRKPETTP
ncbi:MAG: right-handed parallel beta-helix repeat-containing protein [Phycisphaerales bacterium]